MQLSISCKTLQKEDKNGIADKIYFPAFPMVTDADVETIYNDDGTVRGILVSVSWFKKLALFSTEYEDAMTLLSD